MATTDRGTTERATFARMQDSTAADYDIIDRARASSSSPATPIACSTRCASSTRAPRATRSRGWSTRCSRRRARSKDGRDDDYVAMCLLHDIGDTLAPRNHGELAASILKPFVSQRITWIAAHHPVFQLALLRPPGRCRSRIPARATRARVVRRHGRVLRVYDENCFDVRYRSLPLDEFEPLLRAMLERTPRWDSPDL